MFSQLKTPCTLIAPIHLHPYIREELLQAKQGMLGVTLISLNSFLKQELMENRFEQEAILFQYFHKMQDFKEHLQIYQNTATSYTFLNECYQFIEELKQYHITPSQLPSDSASNIELQSIIEQLYPIETPSDQLQRCLNEILKKDLSYVYILDNYHTYFQHSVIQQLQTKGAKLLKIKEQTQRGIIFQAVNKKQECEAVAQYILKNKLKAEDIAITLCDKEYGVLLEQVFEHYQIPFCSFAKSSCAKSIYFAFVSMLQYYLDPNNEHLIAMLSHHLFNIPYRKALMDYLSIFEVDIFASFDHIQNRSGDGNVLNQIDLERFERLEQQAQKAKEELLPYLTKFIYCQNPSEILTFMLETIHQNMNNDTASITIFKDVCDYFSNVIDHLHHQEDLQFLLHGLKQKEIQKESKSIQGICITTLKQIQLPRTYHFILGASSKNYPSFQSKEGIFDEKYIENLPYPSMQERYELHTKSIMHTHLIHQNLIVFHPLGTYDGHSLEGALELENICDNQGSYPISYQHIPLKIHIDQIPSENAKQLFLKENTITGSISSIEKYSKCPYAYFLRYGLGIKDPIQLGFANNYMGTLAHYIMEQLYHEGTKEAFLQLDDQSLKDIIEEEMNIIKEVFPNKQSYLSFLSKRIFKVMKQCIKRFQQQEKTSNYHPWQVEYQFHYPLELEQDITLNLVGIIDRIDITKNFAMVFDYKSSAKTLSDVHFKQGLSLQLPVYAMIVKEHLNKEVAGTYYLSMKTETIPLPYGKIKRRKKEAGLYPYEEEEKKDILISSHKHGGWSYDSEILQYDPEKRYLKNITTYKDINLISNQVRDIFQHLVDHILSGHIKIEPTKDACTFCKHREICRHQGQYREPINIIEEKGE